MACGRVLLTGGNGFVAAHVLNALLARGYSVVTTVRSAEKGEQILAAHPNKTADFLSYAVVPDIVSEGAWDHVINSDRPLDYIVHTASPFPTTFDDPVRDVLEPAMKGTTNILQAAKRHATQVKRVVITSSFAAIANTDNPPRVYDESSWNPITWDDAVNQHTLTYRGSKAIAERAAWDFMRNEQPSFDLVSMNPPLVYGPIAHHLDSLDHLNTSNQKIRDFIQGRVKGPDLPPTGTFLFTDVRDLALAHVRALEVAEAGGKRFFITAGYCSHKRMVDAIAKTHPEIESILPQDPVDDFPTDVYGYSNQQAISILGIKFRTLEECMDDTTKTLQKLGA